MLLIRATTETGNLPIKSTRESQSPVSFTDRVWAVYIPSIPRYESRKIVHMRSYLRCLCPIQKHKVLAVLSFAANARFIQHRQDIFTYVLSALGPYHLMPLKPASPDKRRQHCNHKMEYSFTSPRFPL